MSNGILECFSTNPFLSASSQYCSCLCWHILILSFHDKDNGFANGTVSITIYISYKSSSVSRAYNLPWMSWAINCVPVTFVSVQQTYITYLSPAYTFQSATGEGKKRKRQQITLEIDFQTCNNTSKKGQQVNSFLGLLAK